MHTTHTTHTCTPQQRNRRGESRSPGAPRPVWFIGQRCCWTSFPTHSSCEHCVWMCSYTHACVWCVSCQSDGSARASRGETNAEQDVGENRAALATNISSHTSRHEDRRVLFQWWGARLMDSILLFKCWLRENKIVTRRRKGAETLSFQQACHVSFFCKYI